MSGTNGLPSLSSELGPVAEQLSRQPRVYADANVPAGLVGFMRTRLRWDVLFVVEHEDLRRASDSEHYRTARQLRRTLITLDRDYLDDRRFLPEAGAGVLVISAPDERALAKLLSHLDRWLFRPRSRRGGPRLEHGGSAGLPLEGRKIHAFPGWNPRSS
jgi:hypothetical protein